VVGSGSTLRIGSEEGEGGLLGADGGAAQADGRAAAVGALLV